MPFVATWMDSEDILPNEVIQTKKNMILFIYVL